MVRLIAGEKGTGKTKKLIELINAAATQETGNVVCIEAKQAMTFDIHYHVRLIVAGDYEIASYEAMRGFISGLYAGNYDISHIFIDNLFKIVGGKSDHEAEQFFDWLESFSSDHGVRFTVSVAEDPAHATDGMRKYL
jgi:hypothetical protein